MLIVQINKLRYNFKILHSSVLTLRHGGVTILNGPVSCHELVDKGKSVFELGDDSKKCWTLYNTPEGACAITCE